MARSDEDWFELEKLHFAAQDGNLDEVKRLVENGHDPDRFDQDLAFTPLHYAAREEHLEIARYLLEQGADANAHAADKIGETPLGAVASTCSCEMAQLLTAYGANPNITGWMGLSALHRAKERKSETGIKVYELLSRAAKGKVDHGS